ncbi:5-formyltetrahydrofolate cyclo-ligase [Microbacterium sp. cf332]|uniref:5-formyltetrahydrofolate cyclo-ligase n=1 Tax=Microbacterium sp. cf332 TaxID=1761804 RepID=UPI00088C57C7|nr:5-formyltetrahydrofolate cyclo-ligase [Microbacterium sp. cf332]SDQ57551.1 5-formyltetrahydrofolate cyclo-ligase [Microbacterium sp. cf332]
MTTPPILPLPGRSAALPPLHRQALEALRSIAMGTDIDDTSPLPPEAQLADRLGVSRGTLRRATEELAREGLLRIQPGRGTYVNKHTQVRRTVREQLLPVSLPDSRFDLDITMFVPDFTGSEHATAEALAHPALATASTVFITPDNSLIALRRELIARGVRLVQPVFGGRRGMLLLEDLRDDARFASTLDGAEEVGRLLSLDDLARVGAVDAVVTGAVAVTADGVHVGGGEGYLDLEWAILLELGLVTAEVPVVALVHECQFLDVPLEVKATDLPVDVVLTDTRRVDLAHARQKPAAIDHEWSSGRQAANSRYFRELAARR